LISRVGFGASKAITGSGACSFRVLGTSGGNEGCGTSEIFVVTTINSAWQVGMRGLGVLTLWDLNLLMKASHYSKLLQLVQYFQPSAIHV